MLVRFGNSIRRRAEKYSRRGRVHRNIGTQKRAVGKFDRTGINIFMRKTLFTRPAAVYHYSGQESFWRSGGGTSADKLL